MWRKTSPVSRAFLATGKRASRSSISSMSYPRDAQIPRDVGLSDMAVSFPIPGNPGY